MTRRRGRREASQVRTDKQTETGGGFQWVPLWGWILVFLVPLAASEYMFWRVGRIPSMIMFPIAWIGFWYAMLERSDWRILKNLRKQEEPPSDENG